MGTLSRLGFLALLVASSTVALADPRPFTFTYDTYPEGKGNWEYEQWVTFQHRTDEDPSFTSYNFRHEFEYGVADNFDLAFYVPTWRYERTDDHQGAKFDSVGVEGIVYLTNPVTDPVGLGLYGEINVGEDELEFEYKLLVHKDIGNWTLAYNLILETEVEGVFKRESADSDEPGGSTGEDVSEAEGTETEGVLGHAFGASYSVTKNLRVGGEALIESIYPNWSEYEDTVYYAGPAVNYSSGGNWWVTGTALFQISSVDGEPDFQFRLVAGWEF
ncbi:MAG TPA: hypothetical protein VF669_13280 [Tepidisphaeraceae bacterium]|jgi:hypothetical protein